MKSSPKVVFLTGELSGDMHAANLLAHIQNRQSNIAAWAVGSINLKKAGATIICDISRLSSMGFIEPLKHIVSFLKHFKQIKKAIKDIKPDLIVAVDCQGFNMPLLKWAKKQGFKTTYYIPPQEWQWGSKKGGKKVVACADQLICIFKKAETFYQSLNGNATYVGHPLIDIVQETPAAKGLRATYGLSKTDTIITIFPGSRSQEIKHVYPQLLDIALTLQKSRSNCHIIISVAAGHLKRQIEAILPNNNSTIHLYNGNAYPLMANSALSLCTSGTITLEHALLKVPAIVANGIHPISFTLAKLIVGKKWQEKLPFIALPNILLNEVAMPEFLQDNRDTNTMLETAKSLLDNPKARQKYQDKMSQLAEIIGPKGVLDRAAKLCIDAIEKT